MFDYKLSSNDFELRLRALWSWSKMLADFSSFLKFRSFVVFSISYRFRFFFYFFLSHVREGERECLEANKIFGGHCLICWLCSDDLKWRKNIEWNLSEMKFVSLESLFNLPFHSMGMRVVRPPVWQFYIFFCVWFLIRQSFTSFLCCLLSSISLSSTRHQKFPPFSGAIKNVEVWEGWRVGNGERRKKYIEIEFEPSEVLCGH